MSPARPEFFRITLKGSITWASFMTGPICPLKSAFSHLPRTLNLALPLCPAGSGSPVASRLFPASFLSLSCCVPGPGLLSSSDVSHLRTGTTLVFAGAGGEAARSTAHRFFSVPPITPGPQQLCRVLGSRAELLISGESQLLTEVRSEWIFVRNRVKQSCETTFLFLYKLILFNTYFSFA